MKFIIIILIILLILSTLYNKEHFQNDAITPPDPNITGSPPDF